MLISDNNPDFGGIYEASMIFASMISITPTLRHSTCNSGCPFIQLESIQHVFFLTRGHGKLYRDAGFANEHIRPSDAGFANEHMRPS